MIPHSCDHSQFAELPAINATDYAVMSEEFSTVFRNRRYPACIIGSAVLSQFCQLFKNVFRLSVPSSSRSPATLPTWEQAFLHAFFCRLGFCLRHNYRADITDPRQLLRKQSIIKASSGIFITQHKISAPSVFAPLYAILLQGEKHGDSSRNKQHQTDIRSSRLRCIHLLCRGNRFVAGRHLSASPGYGSDIGSQQLWNASRMRTTSNRPSADFRSCTAASVFLSWRQ